MNKFMVAAENNIKGVCSMSEQLMLDADLPNWRACVEIMLTETELNLNRNEALVLPSSEGFVGEELSPGIHKSRQALHTRLLKLQKTLAGIDFMSEVKNTTNEMRVFNALKNAIRTHKLTNPDPNDRDMKLYESIDSLY